jgi:hypothetical protein
MLSLKELKNNKARTNWRGLCLKVVFRDRSKARTQLDVDASEHNQLLAYA